MNSLKNMHIVIAEDDLDDGEIICQSFKKHNAFSKVSWVKHGKELLDFLKTGNEMPDVILTDINMPIINGIEALENISSDTALKAIPVFIYTSTSNPVYEEKSRELGSMGFLTKPYNLFEFDKIPDQIVKILENKMVLK